MYIILIYKIQMYYHRSVRLKQLFKSVTANNSSVYANHAASVAANLPKVSK